MRAPTKGLSLALAVLVGVTPLTSPLSAYATTQASNQVIVYDTAADDGATTNDGASSQSETDTQSSAADDAVVQEYDATGQTTWTGDDANAERADDETNAVAAESAVDAASDSSADSDAQLTPNSWRYKDGTPVAGDESSEGLVDAQSLSDDLPSGAIARGIDVSSYQREIDWEQVKASGIKFAIIRIGPAYGQVDSYFERNVSECERLGIPYGIYYYSYATSVSEANRDADRVLTWLGNHRPQLPIYYDIEDDEVNPNLGFSKTMLTTTINTFCGRIQAAGFTAGIYSSTSWYRNYLDDSSLRQWDTWVAQWWDHCSYEGSYSLWQYSSEGSVPGIEGNVDMDYAYNFKALTTTTSPTVFYQAHVSDVGWQTYTTGTAGTTGQSKSIEALNVTVINNPGGTIEGSAHVQDIGWMDYTTGTVGTTGQSKRVEAVKFQLTGALAEKYDVYYRVYCQDIGWLGWAKNGEEAGTEGYGYRTEAIEIKLVSKGGAAPGSTFNRYFKNGSAVVTAQAHVQDIGWQGFTASTAGTTGQSKAIEALNFSVAKNPGGSVQCSAHVQDIGWQSYTTGTAGTTGKGKRIEAVKLQLTGALAEKYDVYYRVHCQEFGWMGWAKNGEEAGSEGYGYRVEAIEVCLVAKGGAAPGSTDNRFNKKAAAVSVQAHVSDIGWQAYTTGVAGTTGKSKAIEALNFQVSNSPGGSLQCAAHVQDLGWQGYTSGMAGTTGKSKRLEALKIKLTGALAEQYDVYYRVHVQDFGWLGWAKNGESAGSEGYGKRAEAIEVRLVAKGASAPGSTANCFKKK